MHKHIALGSPSITFNLIGQTMEGTFEEAFGLVGLSSALDNIFTALSAGAAFRGESHSALPLMLTFGMVLT